MSAVNFDVGDTVVVRAMDGLTLVVEPASDGASSHLGDVDVGSFLFADGDYEREETHGHK